MSGLGKVFHNDATATKWLHNAAWGEPTEPEASVGVTPGVYKKKNISPHVALGGKAAKSDAGGDCGLLASDLGLRMTR